jgi:hypothetical protein
LIQGTAKRFGRTPKTAPAAPAPGEART